MGSNNNQEVKEKISHKQGFEFAENQVEGGDRLVTITKAAEIHKVTRQAIYVAIKLNKLKAYKKTSRWMINLDDLDNYRDQRYSRTKSLHNGELIFSKEKGLFSVNQVANLLKVPVQKIYYAMRIGLLKASRKGAAWVIHIDEINGYRSGYLEKKARTAV